eukprot:Skav234156  [mRNA]  locus=scaffold6570:142619:144719:+ [translate_table: standard]
MLESILPRILFVEIQRHALMKSTVRHPMEGGHWRVTASLDRGNEGKNERDRPLPVARWERCPHTALLTDEVRTASSWCWQCRQVPQTPPSTFCLQE